MRSLLKIFVSTLVILGSGCAAVEVSSLTSEQAAASLVFEIGNEIVVQPTILGVGGSVVSWLGADEEERTITITDWVAGQNVSLDWSIATHVETAESVAAREAYEQTYASSPVGVEILPEPEPVYEERLVRGTIASGSLASADTFGLPESWPEGDAGVSTTSLIWLSRTLYDELVNTRSTMVSLGLFDESLMMVEDATNQITSVVGKFSGLFDSILGTEESEESTSDTESLLTLKADPQWGEYTLLVDGIKTKVRVVEAKNAFASYKILANAENPLVLEIQLTPLSQGNLEILNPKGFVKGFGGYEVIQINQKTGD